MAIRKVSPRSIDGSASSANLNIDANTLFLDATNNRIGIGYTSPATALDINGDVTQRNGAGVLIGKVWNDSGVYSIQANSANVLGLKLDAPGTTQYIVASTNGAERMRIDGGGKVTIGTANTDSDSLLTVNMAMTLTNSVAQSLKTQMEVDSTTYYLSHNQYYSGGTWNLYDSGKAPAALQITSTSGSSSFSFQTKNANTAGTVERMSIDGAGKVKITSGAGQQSPATTTDITATSVLAMTAGGGDWFTMGQYSGSNWWMQASYAANPSLAYYNIVMQPLGGAVLIGDATSVGSANCTGLRKGSTGQLILMANSGGLYHQVTGSYYLITTAGGSTSDATLKTNVRQLSGALEKIKAIRGVNFEFIDAPMCTADQGEQLGVIAQEVEAQYPEIVLTDDDGKKTVRYDRLVAPLIEAIKEQQAIIAQLQADVAELKAAK